MRIKNYINYLYLKYIKNINTPKKLIQFAVKRNGKKVFLLENKKEITLNTINNNACKLANYLLKIGIKKGDKVCILSKNRQEFLETKLACYKINAILVSFTKEIEFNYLEYFININNCKVFIFDDLLAENKLYYLKNSSCLEAFISISYETSNADFYLSCIKHASTQEPNIKISPNDISAIGFTSGTTGNPKAVVWQHKAWMNSFYNFMQNIEKNISHNSVYLHSVPLATSGAISILPCLMGGAKNIFLDQFCSAQAWFIIENYKVTRLFTTPSFLINLWEYYLNNSSLKFESLETINIGSAPVDKNCLLKLINTFGNIIEQGYGMAEVLAPIAMLPASLLKKDNSLNKYVGKIAKQVAIKILNKDENGIGKIAIKSKTFGLGYMIEGELFKFKLKNGYFVTNDIGSISKNNFLSVLGREDCSILHNNTKIFSKEIIEEINNYENIKEVFLFNKNNKFDILITFLNNNTTDFNDIKNMILKKYSNHIINSIKLVEKLPYSSSGKVYFSKGYEII